jgi:predicted metalloprotease
MRWEGREKSQNVEDRRRQRRRVAGGIGFGTILIAGLYMLLGGDPTEIIQQAQTQQTPQTQQSPDAPREDDVLADFVSVVLKDTEDVWSTVFREQLGREYRKGVLVLYDGQTSTACGYGSAATGPFYCPGDSKLYIDLSFYRDLKNRFQAPGDFAMAYVVAHEVSHHVQNQLGITAEMENQRRRVSKTEYNKLSVRLELQADFLAGVWTHHAHKMNKILEEGDIEEAMNAAQAIGDDRIQKRTRGYVVPDSFTHGTSEQRMRWYRKGLETGDLRYGDTFAVKEYEL